MKHIRISDLDRECSEIVEIPEALWDSVVEVHKEKNIPMFAFVESLKEHFWVVEDDGRVCEKEIVIV